MIEESQLVGIVESAFAHLECAAELQDYNHAFGFAMYLPDDSRITYENKTAALLQNESELNIGNFRGSSQDRSERHRFNKMVTTYN